MFKALANVWRTAGVAMSQTAYHEFHTATAPLSHTIRICEIYTRRFWMWKPFAQPEYSFGDLVQYQTYSVYTSRRLIFSTLSLSLYEKSSRSHTFVLFTFELLFPLHMLKNSFKHPASVGKIGTLFFSFFHWRPVNLNVLKVFKCWKSRVKHLLGGLFKFHFHFYCSCLSSANCKRLDSHWAPVWAS